MTAWNEAWTERGDVRAHWRPLVDVLSSLGRTGAAGRTKGDGGFGLDRRYDPIPFPLPAAELDHFDAGLGQRARLFDALLDDCGKQTVIGSGALPPTFVAGNPSSVLQQASPMRAYSADLIRCPDGEWRVLADRIGTATFVETPALAAFLPGMCRALLGETLRLASIPALWLGDPGAERRVATEYRRWSVRDACDPAAATVALAGLSREERLALQRRFDAAPWRFVGCMQVAPSVAPSLGRNGLQSMPIVLRLSLQRDGPAWRVAPGGLARVATPGASTRFKHVWIADEAGAGRDPRRQRLGVSVCLPLASTAAE